MSLCPDPSIFIRPPCVPSLSVFLMSLSISPPVRQNLPHRAVLEQRLHVGRESKKDLDTSEHSASS